LKLLLDTHVWLWTLGGSPRLGRTLRQEIENPANEIWLSPVSTWEALLLVAKGRIRIDAEISEWLRKATANYREAPLTHEIVVAAYDLRTEHRDPADRFLAATAYVLDLTLATADAKLLGLGAIRTLANR